MLLKDDEVLIADFSSSLDWSERDNDMDEGPHPWTHRYAAPEVLGNNERDSSSDIWSLGCVYLEMWTVLRGGRISDLKEDMAFRTEHSVMRCYASTGFHLEAWIARMEALPGPRSDNLPSEWIRKMLQHDRKQRPTAHALLSMIQEASAELDAEHMFIGQCCLHGSKETERTVPSTAEA